MGAEPIKSSNKFYPVSTTWVLMHVWNGINWLFQKTAAFLNILILTKCWPHITKKLLKQSYFHNSTPKCHIWPHPFNCLHCSLLVQNNIKCTLFSLKIVKTVTNNKRIVKSSPETPKRSYLPINEPKVPSSITNYSVLTHPPESNVYKHALLMPRKCTLGPTFSK